MRRRARWAGRLGLVAGGTAVGLLLAEGLARLIQPGGGAELLMGSVVTPPGMYAADRDLMYAPVPGFEATGRSLAGPVKVRLNRLGLRGGEPAPVAEPRRWLVLGDSFALSLQVPEEATFEALLDARLGPEVEVWNGGVEGYSTWQETRRYAQVDGALGSRAVLLLYFLGNDLYDNAWFPETIPHWNPDMFMQPPAPSGLSGWLEGHSFLFAQLRVWQNRRSVADDAHRMERWRDELSLFTRGGAAQLQQRLPATEAALAELKARVDSAGDVLLVAVAPPAFQIEPARAAGTLSMVGLDPADADLDAPRQAVLASLDRLGIASCDLVAPLEAAAAAGAQSDFVFDGHWTAEGHRQVAAALEPCMRAMAPW